MKSENIIFFYEKDRGPNGIYCEQKPIGDPKNLPTITDDEIKETIKNNTDTKYTVFKEKMLGSGHIIVIKTVVEKEIINERVDTLEKESGPYLLVDKYELPVIRNHKPCENCSGAGSCSNAPAIDGAVSTCCGKCKKHNAT